MKLETCSSRHTQQTSGSFESERPSIRFDYLTRDNWVALRIQCAHYNSCMHVLFRIPLVFFFSSPKQTLGSHLLQNIYVCSDYDSIWINWPLDVSTKCHLFNVGISFSPTWSCRWCSDRPKRTDQCQVDFCHCLSHFRGRVSVLEPIDSRSHRPRSRSCLDFLFCFWFALKYVSTWYVRLFCRRLLYWSHPPPHQTLNFR